jgi:predicted small lipoprotein YifL
MRAVKIRDLAVRSILFPFLLLALSACGQKGGLYIPQDPAAKAPPVEPMETAPAGPTETAPTSAGVDTPQTPAEEDASEGNKPQNE